MNDSIKLAIERLYQAFKGCKIKDPAKVSCFDFGPNADELIDISNELHNISFKTIAGMEFYAKGWSSWGTKDEVKCFLPRIFEYIADDPGRLDDPACFSLFKYKLQNCFSKDNDEWSDDEKSCIKDFFNNFMEHNLSHSIEIGFIIECVITLGMTPDHIVSKWNSNEKLHKDQVINLFNHFNCPIYGKNSSPKGVYLDKSNKIKDFLDYVYIKLTPEELAEIGFL